jgi:hypothetical protein
MLIQPTWAVQRPEGARLSAGLGIFISTIFRFGRFAPPARNNAKREPANINAERNEKWKPDVSIVAARDADLKAGTATEAEK